jgi:hypothetical protein
MDASQRHAMFRVARSLEYLGPAIFHFFNLSFIELIIHQSPFYKIGNDLASILFVTSTAMILTHVRRKQDPKFNIPPMQLTKIVTYL